MRNWNWWPIRKPWANPRLPDYLWGIETPDSIGRWWFFVIASRLPMRNWNRAQPSGRICRGASRLPMRNWNCNCRFQKHSRKLPDYLWGIETWELMKGLIGDLPLPDYLWGIETRARRGYRHRNVPLPDYLWGIETNVPVVFFIVFVLPDYLWGIETSDSCLWYADSPASRLPMRNWNTNPASPKDAIQFPLPDYLWGIETISNIKTWVIVSGFQTTYEELKLSWAHLLPL